MTTNATSAAAARSSSVRFANGIPPSSLRDSEGSARSIGTVYPIIEHLFYSNCEQGFPSPMMAAGTGSAVAPIAIRMAMGRTLYQPDRPRNASPREDDRATCGFTTLEHVSTAITEWADPTIRIFSTPCSVFPQDVLAARSENIYSRNGQPGVTAWDLSPNLQRYRFQSAMPTDST